MSRFRDPVARDKAWGRYYARRGLKVVTRDTRPIEPGIRLSTYVRRRELSAVRTRC